MVQLELYVEDIEDAARIFGVFGFQVIQNDKPGFQVLKDESGFELMLFNPDLNGEGVTHWDNLKTTQRGVGAEIVVVVTNIEQKYKYVQDLGYVCSELKMMPWGTDEFVFEMKDGYLLRIKQYMS